jgi:hypothetical protein
MKKTLLIAGALLALTAGMASAAGLNLYWNDCSPAAGGTGVQSLAHLCATNNGSFQLVGSLVAPAGIVAAVAQEAVVDIQTNQSALSPWWNFSPSGTCRSTALSLSFTFAGQSGACFDPWGGSALGISDVSTNPAGDGHPELNRERVRAVCAVPESSALPMDAGSEYYLFVIQISRTKSVGTGCPGCLDDASFVFNSCKITQPIGTPGGDPTISGAADNQCAGLGPINPTNCLATPTRNATWGAIKAIYR